MKTMLLLVAILLLNGCGETQEERSAAFEGTDNSELADYKSSLGYFGGDTVFGEVPMEGKWSYYYVDTEDEGTIIRYKDGVATLYSSEKIKYGVSKDGNQVNLSSGDYFYITTSTIYRTTSSGADCYRIQLVSSSNQERLADTCPDDR